MRIVLSFFFMVMPGGMHPQQAPMETPSPGDASDGNWVPFYQLPLGVDRLEYFYDRSSIIRHEKRVLARWKVIGSSPATVTLTVAEFDCEKRIFSERGTVLIDANGARQSIPSNELFTDHQIEAGKSAAVFYDIVCQ
jgi:hypothetical protein